MLSRRFRITIVLQFSLLVTAFAAAQSDFIRGDSNANGSVDISDPVFSLDFLFNMGPSICMDAQDVNDDGAVNLADPVSNLAFQFNMGPLPPAPFPACGPDPTMDTIDCVGPVGACPPAAPPTAFRITNLELRDPHLFTSIVLLCLDSTNTINDMINDSFIADSDSDGVLDLSYLLVFRPLDQMSATGSLDFVFAPDCTIPAGAPTCDVGLATTSVALTYSNAPTGTCLQTIPGTTSGYAPAITTPSGPCFVTDPSTLALNLGGIIVTLQDAQIAATYSGNPATSVIDGLGRGFISEADAAQITIPATLPIVGGLPFTALLPGGAGNCASGDDRDTGPDGTTSGWYIYFNFTALAVNYVGP